eukprot:m.7794 g.7794  ORF g.7794 m.7794 type:complete len:810 (+) comp8938_c0_seq2:189-2618(+)
MAQIVTLQSVTLIAFLCLLPIKAGPLQSSNELQPANDNHLLDSISGVTPFGARQVLSAFNGSITAVALSETEKRVFAATDSGWFYVYNRTQQDELLLESQFTTYFKPGSRRVLQMALFLDVYLVVVTPDHVYTISLEDNGVDLELPALRNQTWISMARVDDYSYVLASTKEAVIVSLLTASIKSRVQMPPLHNTSVVITGLCNSRDIMVLTTNATNNSVVLRSAPDYRSKPLFAFEHNDIPLRTLGPSSLPACNPRSKHIYFRTQGNDTTDSMQLHRVIVHTDSLDDIRSFIPSDLRSSWPLQTFDGITSLSVGTARICLTLGLAPDTYGGTYVFVPAADGDLVYVQGFGDSDGEKTCLLARDEALMLLTVKDSLIVYNQQPESTTSATSTNGPAIVSTAGVSQTPNHERSALSNPQVIIVAVVAGSVVMLCLLFFAYKWRQMAWKSSTVTNYVSLTQHLHDDEFEPDYKGAAAAAGDSFSNPKSPPYAMQDDSDLPIATSHEASASDSPPLAAPRVTRSRSRSTRSHSHASRRNSDGPQSKRSPSRRSQSRRSAAMSPALHHTSSQVEIVTSNMDIFGLIAGPEPGLCRGCLEGDEQAPTVNRDGVTVGCSCKAERFEEIISGDTNLLLMRDKALNTPLHTAVQLSHSAMVDVIVRHGDENTFKAYDDRGYTGAHWAAMIGDVDTLKAFGPVLEFVVSARTEKWGDTMLHLCVQEGNLEALQVLLELDACWPILDSLNAKAQTAEDLAKSLNFDDCVEALQAFRSQHEDQPIKPIKHALKMRKLRFWWQGRRAPPLSAARDSSGSEST